MPVPTPSTTHVPDTLALIISRYRTEVSVTGMQAALSAEVQKLEDAAWAVLNALQLTNQPLGGGPWDILDQLAWLVGVPGGVPVYNADDSYNKAASTSPRLGRSDADLLQAIKIQLRINRSNGLAEDIIGIVALVVTGAVYLEWYPAAWEVDIFNTTSSVVAALVQYLGKARAAGTSGNIRYSTFAGPFVTLGYSGSGVGFGYGGSGATLVDLRPIG